MKKNQLLVAAMVAVSLTQVGCSIDDIDLDDNETPTITMPASITVEEKQSRVIAATVDDDGAVSYQWSQLSGIPIEMVNPNDMQLGFIAPSVAQNELVQLKLTATDAEGETAEAITSVNIAQKWLEAEVNGEVTHTHGQLFNIEAKVGNSRFVTQSNATGAFSLKLQFDDDVEFHEHGSVIKVNANALDSKIAYQAHIVENIPTLLEGAARSEWQLSSATTAKSELLSRSALYQDIVHVDDLNQLSIAISNNSYVNNTVAYTLLVEHTALENENDGLTLPQGYASTLDFIYDISAFQRYVSLLEPETSTQFEDKKLSLIASDIFKQDRSRLSCLVFNRHESKSVPDTEINFNDDGTGEITFLRTPIQSFIWQQEGNRITLTKEGGFIGEDRSKYVDFNGERVFTRVVNSYPELTLYLVEHTPLHAVIYLAATVVETYPDIDKAPTSRAITTVRQGFSNAHFSEFMSIELGQVYSFPHIGYQSVKLLFESSNSGVILDYFEKGSERAFTWSMHQHDSGHQYLRIETESFIKTIEMLGKSEVSNYFYVTKVSKSDDSSDGVSNTIRKGGLLNSTALTPDDVVGIYSWQGSLGMSINTSWFELLDNGKGYWVTTNDKNDNGTLESDEVSLYLGDWLLDGNEVHIPVACPFDDCEVQFNFYWHFSSKVLNRQYIHTYQQRGQNFGMNFFVHYDHTSTRPVNVALPEWVYEYLPR